MNVRARNRNRVLLLCLAVCLAWATPAAEARTTTLVGNIDQPDAPEDSSKYLNGVVANTNSVAVVRAQRFTTGANPGGYALAEIVVNIEHGSSDEIADFSLRRSTTTAQGQDAPGALVAALSGSVRGQGFRSGFAPQAATVLAASTSYFVVFRTTRSSVVLHMTESDSVDDGAAPGWDMAGVSLRREEYDGVETGRFDAVERAIEIAVRGTANGAPGNRAPVVAHPIPNLSATADTAFSHAFPANTFSDADDDALTYAATQGDGAALPSWLGFVPATRTFSGTPAAGDVGTLTVRVTADDGNGGTAEDEFDIDVGATPNIPPTASNRTVRTNEDTDHPFRAGEFGFSDNDSGDSLVDVKIVTLPTAGELRLGGMTVVQASLPRTVTDAQLGAGSLAYVPPPDANGTGYASFTFRVNDGTDDSASTYTMTVNVTAVNDAPVLANPIQSRAATADTAFSHTIPGDTFRDADNDLLTYSATESGRSALPSWLGFVPATRAFSGTPAASDAGTLTVRVTVDDGNGATAQDEFDIVVGAAPTDEAHTPALVSNIDQPDAPDDSNKYLNGVVANTNSVAVVRAQRFTTGANPGGYTLAEIVVNIESGHSDEIADFSLRQSTTTGQGQAAPGALVAALSGSVRGHGFRSGFAPHGATVLAPSTSYFVVFRTKRSSIVLRMTESDSVDDGAAPGWDMAEVSLRNEEYDGVVEENGPFDTVERAIEIGVRGTANGAPGNRAPVVAHPIPNLSATAGTAFSHAFPANTFSDADDDTLTYAATKGDGTDLSSSWLSFAAAPRTFSGTPAAGDVGTLTVRVTADDGNGATAEDEFDIVVSATANSPPTASDGMVRTNEDTDHPFRANEFGFSDNDSGDSLADVKIVTLPTAGELRLGGMAVDPTSLPRTVTVAQLGAGSLKFVPAADANGTGYASFTFRVNDGTDDSATAYTMTVNVTAVNDAPVLANMIPNRSATADTSFSYAFPANTFSDVDDVTLTYSATQDDGTALPSWLSFAAATRTFSGTPAAADAGTLTVRVTASDPGSASVSDSFDLTVAAADTAAPELSAAAVVGATLTLTYGEALDTASTPAAADFTVQADGSPVSLASVTPVTVSGQTVTLTLASAVTQGQTVTVSYAPGGNPIQDAAGNDAAALTGQAVTNQTVETTAPVLSSATVLGATLTLTYGEALDTASIPDAADFTVQVDGSPVSLASGTPVAVGGQTVTLTLASAVTQGQTVTVSYAPGSNPIQDGAGNDAAALTDRTVTNNTVDTSVPPMSQASEVRTVEDTDHAFAAADFPFTDDNPGDVLASVKVTSLPASGYGALEFDGTALAAGDLPKTVEVDELGQGKLVYSPVAGQFGDGYASFMFKVNDGEADSEAHAMTVHVDPGSGNMNLVDNLYADADAADLGVLAAGHASSRRTAQGFHTGDDPSGYLLRSVGVRVTRNLLAAGQTLTLAVYDADADGALGDLVHTLVTPWASVADIPLGIAYFVAPAGSTLLPNTDYHVELQIRSGAGAGAAATQTIGSDAETGEADWEIEDALRINGTFLTTNFSARIAVRGVVSPVPVSLAPTSEASEVRTVEDNDHAFTAANFPFTDGNPGDVLASVKVTSLPASGYGALEFDGTALAAGDLPKTVSAAELGQGKLVYSPVAGQFGDGYASFMFKVNDGEADSEAHAMTVHVDPGSGNMNLVDNLYADADAADLGVLAAGHASSRRTAQGFHTGDDPSGYLLRSVGVRVTRNLLAAGQTLTLAVYDADADGALGDLVHTLVTPWASVADIPLGIAYFVAPAGSTLLPNTDYHVELQIRSGAGAGAAATQTIGSDAETGEADWEIEDALRINGTFLTTNFSARIAVRGIAVGASFDSDAYTAIEGGAGAEVTVTLIPLPETAVEVPLTVTSRDGGASAADHSEIPASLSFAAGVGSRTFTVTATDDGVDAEGKSITIGFGELPAGYRIGAHATATVSLADNDETVRFDASAYSAAEGGTAAEVTVTLSTAPPTPIQVPLTVTRNGDTGVDDYSGVPATLTFAAMQASATFTVAATDDAADDDGESITLALGDLPAPYLRGSVPEATVALADNDAPLAANGEFSTTADTGYALGAEDFRFDGTDGDLLAGVKIVTLPGMGALTLDGEAIALADLPTIVTRAELDNGKLVYAPPAGATGNDLTSFTFRVNDGTSDSAVYTMTVDVEAAGATVDTEVNFGAPAYAATEGGTAATVEVTLSRAPSAEVQIPLSVLSRNWGAVAGDHSTIPSTVTFATTDTSQTVTVTATDDELNDDGESVTLGFGTLPTGYAAGPTETTTVSLADNDGVLVSNTGKTPAARSSANLEDNDYEAYFTTGPHPAGYVVDSIELTLTNTGNSAVSRSNLNSGISVLLSDLGADFQVHVTPSGSLGANTTATVRLTAPVGTTLRPSSRHQVVILSEATGDLDDVYWRHTASTAQDAASAPGWSIRDNAKRNSTLIPPLMLRVNGHPAATHNPAVDIEVSFGAAEYSAAEGGTAATVEVALGRAPRTPVVIPLTFSHTGGAGSGDHSPIPASLTFAAGVGSRAFTVRALDDSDDDDGESVTLGFGDLPPGYGAAAGASTVVALVDNDGARTLVSNLLQDPPNTRAGDRFTLPSQGAQDFHTGAHHYGFELAAFDLALRDAQLGFDPVPPRVWLASGSPLDSGDDGVELIGPAALPSNAAGTHYVAGVHRYTAPPGTYLDPNAGYWLVMEGLDDDFVRSAGWEYTQSRAEDPGASPGWRIGDTTVAANTETMDISIGRNASYAFAVRGVPLTGPYNRPATGEPGIAGRVLQGGTLTAEVPGTIEDGNGLSSPQWSYRWIRTLDGVDVDIEGATAATYTLTLDDVGHTIRLEVAFTDDDGFAETRASAATSGLIVPTAGIVRVPHDWALIPPQSNLGAGGQFRLMFVTAHPDVTGANREPYDLIDATSTDIATYNEFVQQAAFGGHADIQAYAGHFRALASTAAVNARDNTATTATDTDTAVHWLGRRGDNQSTIARFYGAGNARWKQRETQRDDDGNALTMGFNDFVWTGTATDGTTDSAPLGSARPAHAEPAQQFGQMDNGQNERDNTVELPLYALSGVFEVAAEPGGSGDRRRGVSGGFAPERAATGAARDGDSGPALGDGRAPGDANVDGIATDEAIPRGPGVVVGGRLPELDIVLPADADPTGLWSDGRTMWVVSDRGTGEVTTWSLADGRALGAGEVLLADGATRATHRFTLTGGGGDPAGLWSDGATLWVADALGGVRAYRLSDGRRTADGDIADEVLAAAGNHRPTGLWSDGVTLWVADNGAWKVFAYALPDRRRAADREFELADRAGALLSPWGLWSDGETLLVSNHFDGGVLGFALADGAPRTDLAANAAPGGGRPLGLWSDGRTVWVVREGDRRIRAHAASGLRPRHPADPPDVFAVRVRTRAGAVPRGRAAGAPAAIADPALRDAVAAALDLEPHAAVRVRAMAALRSLDLRGAGVADLAGLEHAANLAALDLADNPVRDLSPLTALANLRVLGLGGVDADPWPLSALSGLRRLSLRGGGLTDVWALAGLVDLEVLDLSGNPVADLRPLSGMRRLRALRLDGAADLSPLDGLDALVELEVDGLPRSRAHGGPGRAARLPRSPMRDDARAER